MKRMSLLEALADASAIEDEVDSMRVIWEHLDSALRKSEFDAVDKLLEDLDLKATSTSALFGTLTVIAPAKPRLENHQKFAALALEELRNRGLGEEDLKNLD